MAAPAEHGLFAIDIAGHALHIDNAMVGTWGLTIVILVLALLIRRYPMNGAVILFKSIFETLHDFFMEILGGKEKKWIVSTVLAIFFIVLFSNVLAVFVDAFNFAYPIEHYFVPPTTNLMYNMGIAIFIVVLVFAIQIMYHGWRHFAQEFVPVFGKNIVTVERGNMPGYVYRPLKVFVKIFDIVLSLFLGFLEVVGNIAKVISLSNRLFGNMLAGTILVTILVTSLNLATQSIVGLNIPFLVPILLYLQGLLVGVIQAFVMALLAAIFIRVARGAD